MKKITTKGIEVGVITRNEDDFISLTDLARYKDNERTNYIIQNWMRKRTTIEYLGLWERINNSNFKGIEFDAFRSQAGLNSFSLTPSRWVDATKATGIIVKAGRYNGGVYAHKDIAFEFASWLSEEFRLYLIKEFQRLKFEENERISTGWDVKRTLTKMNYHIHTDAIKQNLIPEELSPNQKNMIYANEADVLNLAIFGMTAAAWVKQNPKKEGNIRDYASVEQLVVLANLESLNAEFIRSGLSQSQRLGKLNQIAIYQMRAILGTASLKKLTKQSLS